MAAREFSLMWHLIRYEFELLSLSTAARSTPDGNKSFIIIISLCVLINVVLARGSFRRNKAERERDFKQTKAEQ
jgi:hypothetical protein